MKIRNGFVSNSSSSSFIVALNPKEKCPHCGRSSQNILDILESTNGYNDTQLRWTDPTEYIEDLQQEIYSNKLDLEKLVNKSDNEDVVYNYNTGNTYTYKVKQLRKWANDVISRNSELICGIKETVKSGKQVISFDIDYHDPLLNNIVREQINNGELEVLDEDS
jgi:hypothetical protein